VHPKKTRMSWCSSSFCSVLFSSFFCSCAQKMMVNQVCPWFVIIFSSFDGL
jgi:hypothetical protein